MSLPSTFPLEPGAGHLSVTRVAGLSAVTSACAASPLKLLLPRARGLSAWVCSSSFGGGLLAGDRIRLDLQLGDNTRCFLGTQAATKVYRNSGSSACGQQLQATLGTGALLVLAPDPVQPFAGSRYTQEQNFHLSRGSGLVLLDCLTAGRAACGERWAFESFRSRNHVFLEGEPILADSLQLDDAQGPMALNSRMGRFNCLALVALIGEPLAGAAAQLLADVAAQPLTRRASLIASASPIRQGALLRVAGEQVEDVAREIRRHLAFLGGLLGECPWERK
jgi:urease accessory protein